MLDDAPNVWIHLSGITSVSREFTGRKKNLSYNLERNRERGR
jgi:hypothetical protein